MRSQIAEALYKKYKNTDVLSAGVFPIIENHDGKKLKDLDLEEVIQDLKEKEGIDISENICKELTEELVQKSDRVIVMMPKEMYPDFLEKRKDVIEWDIENKFTDDLVSRLKEKVLSLH